jgi:branched-chain amino acid transport system ATP-binding protein
MSENEFSKNEEQYPPLALDDLHVAFGGNRVLEGVNIKFTNGFNGLIGPNGAGKTTIFNVLSGYVKPTKGAALLEGKDLSLMKQTGRVRNGISRTFQSPKLILDATVMENVLLGMHANFKWGHASELVRWPQQRNEETEARRKCMDMLEAFGLAADAHKETGDLSLGSQKLVEVCRALVSEPKVLLLDEPAAGLGAEDVTILLSSLRRIVDETDLCLVIIEHDLDLVTTLCPMIYVLHFGRIISEGPPEVITSDPVVIEAYLGKGYAPAGNESEGKLDAI